MLSNAQLHERRAAAVARGVSSATDIYVSRAENAELWDVEGRRYIDFAGGIAVLNVGHRHPRVIEAVKSQLNQFTHTAFQVAAYEPYIRLAERLNKLAPIEGSAKSVFFSTGAEAVENAVKIARVATGRTGVLAFTGGFHGRTLLASGLTGKVSPYKRAAGPFPPDIYHLPFPAADNEPSMADLVASVERLFASDIEPDRVAAIIFEPVQGEGGFNVASAELVSFLAELRRQHGILIIADEVQTGIARTGKLFAIEHFNIQPDLLIVAKSLGGGFPLSGVIGRAALMDTVHPGGLGGTFGGSPVSCAAANAVLDVVEEEALIARSVKIGERLKNGLRDVSRTSSRNRVSNLRGLGAMVAFDVAGENGRLSGEETRSICRLALTKGLIVLNCGAHGQAIRLLIPLTASDEILDEGVEILKACLS